MKHRVCIMGIAAVLLGMLWAFSAQASGSITRPVRPTTSTSFLDGLNTTALGQPNIAHGESGGNPGGHGIRGTTYTNFGIGGYGNADIKVDDGVPLGSFISRLDLLCISTGPTYYDSSATSASKDTPYTFDAQSTNLVTTNREWLLPAMPPYGMTTRYETMIDNVWAFGSTVAYPINPPQPLNIVSMTLPWSGAGISQIWLGGLPAKPTTPICTDSAGGTSWSDTDGTGTTPVPQTGNPVLSGDGGAPCDTGSAACADKQIHGWWVSPSIANAPEAGTQCNDSADSDGDGKVNDGCPAVGIAETGIQCDDDVDANEDGAPDKVNDGCPAVANVAVTKRVLNNGPEPGSFKDVWHAEAPANVTAAWSTSITASPGPNPTVNGSGAEIWFDETDLAVGTTVTYTGSIQLTCTVGGDYLVTIKDVAYPKAGTVDNSTGNNEALTTIRVKCPAAGSEVDKQVLSVSPWLKAISGPNQAVSAGFNRPLGSGPAGVELASSECADNVDDDSDGKFNDGCPPVGAAETTCTEVACADGNGVPPWDNCDDDTDGKINDGCPGVNGDDPYGGLVQLIVGDTATLEYEAIVRNQSNVNAAGEVLLVAEAPDLDGGGTYDITVDWDTAGHPLGSVSVVYGSEPANQTPLTPGTVSKITRGGMDAGLTIPMTEPYGPQILVKARVDIKCDSAGTFMVPVKVVDRPTAHGDSNIANNVLGSGSLVRCWTNEAAKLAADDGIDDATGLYPKWTTHRTDPDVRKSVPPYPATGIASDTGYVERWIDFDCIWNDASGADAGGDGWVTSAESQADPDIPDGYDDYDSDGDCLADPTYAQPGHPVDEDDSLNSVNCATIVYNEGSGPFSGVTYDTAADMDCDGLLDGVEKAYGSNPKLADSDSDGATDFQEMFMLTNPVNPDTDGDAVLDKPEDDYQAAAAGSAESGESANYDDNCPLAFNPTQANNDGQRRPNGTKIPEDYASNPNTDKMGDACDIDDDNDTMVDVAEVTDEGGIRGPTDPLDMDSDNDGCHDAVELQQGSDPNDAGDSYCDEVGWSAALQVYYRGCHINIPDKTVWSGFSPGYSGADWVEMDPDGDGILCPTDPDSDNGMGTGLAGKTEVLDVYEAFGYGTSIVRKDTDGDGCEDWIEINDVNGDRTVDSGDKLVVAKRAAGKLTGDPVSDYVFDINKDQVIDSGDKLLVSKNTCGLKNWGGCPLCTDE